MYEKIKPITQAKTEYAIESTYVQSICPYDPLHTVRARTAKLLQIRMLTQGQKIVQKNIAFFTWLGDKKATFSPCAAGEILFTLMYTLLYYSFLYYNANRYKFLLRPYHFDNETDQDLTRIWKVT